MLHPDTDTDTAVSLGDDIWRILLGFTSTPTRKQAPPRWIDITPYQIRTTILRMRRST
jgi:hypothetical protein